MKKAITLFSVFSFLYLGCSTGGGVVPSDEIEHIEFKREGTLYRTESLIKEIGSDYIKAEDAVESRVFISIEDADLSEGNTYLLNSAEDVKLMLGDTLFTQGQMKVTTFNSTKVKGTFSATKAKVWLTGSGGTDSFSTEFPLNITAGSFYLNR